MTNTQSLACEFSARIKLYADGADEKTMLSLLTHPLVQGFTTNPSLMNKAGVKDYVGFCKQLLQKITDKPVSFEVFADDLEDMYRQALEICTWGPHVYVKIPIMNTQGQSTRPIIERLTQAGVQLNITAIFTYQQVYETVSALKSGAPAVVSVFAGRIADAGYNPIPLMQASSALCRAVRSDIELLWASTREAYNIIQAEQCGCAIITVPPDIIKKVDGFGKDPFTLSQDTVLAFKRDACQAGYKL